MHLIVPFAAPLSEAGRHALQTLKLPQLDAALGRMTLAWRDTGDERSLSTPHERALAGALGFAGADGELPWGAREAARHGIDTAGDLAWGLVTPVHWEVAADHIRLSDPDALALDETSARTFFNAVHPLFESEGVALVYAGPGTWVAAHESLAHLATASPDRVIGRQLDTWLPQGANAKLMRRLQNEVQMLLHTHPLNEEREEEGYLPMNSFWLSGCGLPQVAALPEPVVDSRLRTPALSEDWAAWTEAWRTLDADLGSLQPTVLTLCGERGAAQFDNRARGLWQRVQSAFRGGSALALLDTL